MTFYIISSSEYRGQHFQKCQKISFFEVIQNYKSKVSIDFYLEIFRNIWKIAQNSKKVKIVYSQFHSLFCCMFLKKIGVLICQNSNSVNTKATLFLENRNT